MQALCRSALSWCQPNLPESRRLSSLFQGQTAALAGKRTCASVLEPRPRDRDCGGLGACEALEIGMHRCRKGPHAADAVGQRMRALSSCMIHPLKAGVKLQDADNENQQTLVCRLKAMKGMDRLGTAACYHQCSRGQVAGASVCPRRHGFCGTLWMIAALACMPATTLLLLAGKTLLDEALNAA